MSKSDSWYLRKACHFDDFSAAIRDKCEIEIAKGDLNKPINWSAKNDKFYVLAPRGVYPAEYLPSESCVLTLDQNIFTTEKLTELSRLYDEQNVLLSPAFTCVEGEKKRLLTREEFSSEYASKISKLQDYFSSAQIHEHPHLEFVYESISRYSDFDSEIKFIKKVRHALDPNSSLPVFKKQLEMIKELAIENLPEMQNELVFIAALQFICSGSKKYDNPGQRILAPRGSDNNDDSAFNSAADLLRLKVIALSNLGSSLPYLLVTGDKGLALFWSGLEMSGVPNADPVQLKIRIRHKKNRPLMFPKLKHETFQEHYK